MLISSTVLHSSPVYQLTDPRYVLATRVVKGRIQAQRAGDAAQTTTTTTIRTTVYCNL